MKSSIWCVQEKPQSQNITYWWHKEEDLFVCEGFTAQSIEWGHVDRGQFT